MGGGGGGKSDPVTDPFRLVKGNWGDPKTVNQRGIITYALSANRQNPLAGVWRAAIFNTFRRTRNQILYWSIPLLIGYETMQWAIERNEYLNSKSGRAEYGDAE